MFIKISNIKSLCQLSHTAISVFVGKLREDGEVEKGYYKTLNHEKNKALGITSMYSVL